MNRDKMLIEIDEQTYHVLIGCLAELDLDYKDYLKVIKKNISKRYIIGT